MESPKMDLEKELTCSICTELLYQPLTLLDCLHTFCGACVKEWFSFQAYAAETNPTPPAPGKAVFTCPSCRDAVRSTRHNATVVTLLDMLLTAQPEKRKPAGERAEMDSKYRPGENVIPKLRLAERTAEQQRLDAEEQRLVDEVRELSRQEAVAGGGGGSSLQAVRPRSHRESSRQGSQEGSRDDSRQRGSTAAATATAAALGREMGHQSSLRSLISRSDQGSSGLLDIEREIEEFARQIQEEGILDGLDLDNIDLGNDDELSRRIAEAYQRRQRGRSRPDGGRRSNASGTSRRSDVSRRPPSSSRHRSQSRSSQQSQQSSQPGGHSPSASSSSLPAPVAAADRSRPPAAAARLEVRDEPRHHRHRAASEGRSTSLPTVAQLADSARPGARSQVDLGLRQERSGESSSLAELDSHPPTFNTLPLSLPFRQRASGLELPGSSSGPAGDELPLTTTHFVSSPRTLSDGFDRMSLAAVSPPSSADSSFSTQHQHRQRRPLVFTEPAITCGACGRDHIEYEVHYNCAVCSHGHWNICLDCYRRGRGCQHWFGFGYTAWQRWEKAAGGAGGAGGTPLAPPHMLTANRYLRPQTANDDPQDRLQSGVFCAGCQAWANSCYWRCDVCNDGDWGFCNGCVDQGRACTHALLPLAHQSSSLFSGGGGHLLVPPPAPRSARPLQTAAGKGEGEDGSTTRNKPRIGSFRPLTFATKCDMCRRTIGPTRPRFHCYTCHSSAPTSASPEPEETPGDYDLCEDCYAPGALVGGSNIAAENGPAGWRRCPAGHRMVVVAFREDSGGMQRRVVLQDLVGGRRLQTEEGELQTWYIWFGQQRRYERLVSANVRVEAPPFRPAAGPIADDARFPPSGGIGRTAVAGWAWYPEAGADDELAFPKKAEVREIEDVNGEWFYGTYMGRQGLFPGGYVKMD